MSCIVQQVFSIFSILICGSLILIICTRNLSDYLTLIKWGLLSDKLLGIRRKCHDISLARDALERTTSIRLIKDEVDS